MILEYELTELIPDKKNVLLEMGIRDQDKIPDDVQYLCDQANKIYKELAAPKGIISKIDKADFIAIMQGEGMNEYRIPLEQIIEEADHLALYAFTMGSVLSDKIHQLIHDKDYPLGYVLDIIASQSTEKATEVEEERISDTYREKISKVKSLLYSPGYCGWHITAQHKLFKYLEPQKIGISLNESSLMTPIKSVTGVMVSGLRKTHYFKNNFYFCKSCQNFACRERIKR